MTYIDQRNEAVAQTHNWTYETGYNQGYQMGMNAEGDNNYFPKFTNAWYGHKEGYKDGKAARKRGY